MTTPAEVVHVGGCNARCGVRGHWLLPSGPVGEPFSHQRPPDIDADDEYTDDDPRCTHCNGEPWLQECDDPLQCCDPRCDGQWHPCVACGGTGLYEHQVIF